MNREPFLPTVYFEDPPLPKALKGPVTPRSRPIIVFAKGRTKYHAIEAGDSGIRLIELESLRYLRPVMRNGEPYPARRAASFWLNHSWRPITKRAKAVLRTLVARQPKDEA